MAHQASTLSSLTNPKSIAIVGASTDPQKLGSTILSNVIDSGFEGDVYPINLKGGTIQGLQVYKNIKEVPGDIDTACIVIPRKFVESVIDDCIEKDVKSVVIISAGFSEVDEKGAKLEKQIATKCKQNDINLLGPNCLGILSPDANLNLSFAASHPQKGNIAFLSQSGAFCTAMLDLSLEQNLGFFNFVSVGNKVDIDENKLINYWNENSDIKVVGAYLEEINKGIQFISNAHKLDKPLIVLKSGKSEEAKEAIASHTGSMAGSSQAVTSAFAKAGVIEVNQIKEMFDTMVGFSWAPLPQGPNVGIVTNAGGPGIITTDTIIEHGLKMANLSDKTQKSLTEVLPQAASVDNPIDVIGDAKADRYENGIKALIQEDNVDSIVVVLTPQLITQIEETAKNIMQLSKTTDKPIFAVLLGKHYVQSGLRILHDFEVPAFSDIKNAISTLSKMYTFYKYQKKAPQLPNIQNYQVDGKYEDEMRKFLKQTQNSNKAAQPIPETLTNKITNEFALPLPAQAITVNYDELLTFAHDNFPVALKATTEDLAHKTDKQAVFLDLKDEEEFKRAYNQIEEVLRNAGVSEPKFLVQEFITDYQPLFIGSNRDGDPNIYKSQSGFGHLMALGYGGIYTEIFNDIEFTLLPNTREQIKETLSKTKVWEIMKGARGKETLAIQEAIDIIMKIQKMLLTYPQIKSVDFNPILVTTEKAVAVDIKIFVG
jgi:acetyltransferase